MSFAMVAVAVGVTVGNVQPSKGCGPFRELDLVFHYITDLIASAPETVSKALFFLGQTSILYAFALLLIMLIYFSYAYSHAQAKLAGELRSDLVEISKDRLLLLSEFNEQLVLAKENNGES